DVDALAEHFGPGQLILLLQLRIMLAYGLQQGFKPDVVKLRMNVEAFARMALAKGAKLGVRHAAREQHQVENAGSQQMLLRRHVALGRTSPARRVSWPERSYRSRRRSRGSRSSGRSFA